MGKATKPTAICRKPPKNLGSTSASSLKIFLLKKKYDIRNNTEIAVKLNQLNITGLYISYDSLLDRL
jgi:hypothetical protein